MKERGHLAGIIAESRSAGQSSRQVARRQGLIASAKLARARFFQAERAIDDAVRAATARVAGQPELDWTLPNDTMEESLKLYVTLAKYLPRSPREIE